MRALRAFVAAMLIVLGSAAPAVASISFGLPNTTRGVERAETRGPASHSATSGLVVGTLVATIGVGGGPGGVAYDSRNGYVYVANLGTDNVSVISGIAVVATIPIIGGGPRGVAYDGDNGYVYVAHRGDNVSVISGTSVAAEVPVGRTPDGVGYDSGNGYVYVTNRDSNTVSVISNTTVIGTVPVGSDPVRVGYASGNGFVYVTNYGFCPFSCSGTVSVISGMTVLGTVTNGNDPVGVAYNSANGYAYVTNSGSGTVSVMSFTVVPPPASTFLGLPVVAGYAMLAGFVVLVVLSVVFGLRKLRRKQVIK